ncbi:MAG: hypothetical protein CVU44_08000 [Chloroflexi bacterium HGW-Chloroflexi-6]|nr:MAG: hypothetical protein CVU44_08000 [Chloroflexi bacterium HGW-Chloroflexi-6]
MSQLGKKLIYPPKPNFPLAALTTRGGIISFVFIAILLFAILGNAIFLRLFPSVDICGFILFLVVGVFIVTPITKNTLIPILSKKNAEYKERYEQWRIVKNLWDNAYYCQRHDVVFMNGNQQTIPLDKFQSFLLRK